MFLIPPQSSALYMSKNKQKKKPTKGLCSLDNNEKVFSTENP